MEQQQAIALFEESLTSATTEAQRRTVEETARVDALATARVPQALLRAAKRQRNGANAKS